MTLSPTNPSVAPRVVIVGGGLAGLAAAVRLAERRVPAAVIETRMRLGGRATSFVDPTSQTLLDNCQHVLMRCCTNLIDLYQRLGVEDRIVWSRRLYWANRAGEVDTLEAEDMPAPLHMTRAMIRFKLLTPHEKIAISRAMIAIMRTSRRERDALDRESFADWLRRRRQPDGAVKRYWEVVIVSACNETLENVSAKYALQVFQEGFLNHPVAYEMGLSSVPLVELYDPAERIIRAAGGRLLLQTGAEAFIYRDRRVAGLKLRSGEIVDGDVFISAAPFDRLHKLSDDAMRRDDERLQRLNEITVSPIVGIHLCFRTLDRSPVMRLPHLIFQESPIQWVFNKGADLSAGGEGAQHLHCVVSAAHELADQPAEAIISLAVSELQKMIPAVRNAALVHGRVVKEKRATFAVRPGLDAIRPDATGAICNLILAGDWTRTGWPATMEGAVRSGYRAAAAALDVLGMPSDGLLVDDLQPDPFYRAVAR